MAEVGFSSNFGELCGTVVGLDGKVQALQQSFSGSRRTAFTS